MESRATGINGQVGPSSHRRLKLAISLAIIVGLTGYFIWETTLYVPPEKDARTSLPGQFVPAQDSGQIPIGAQYSAYSTNPPTSGPYWAPGTDTLPTGLAISVPPRWGIYNQTLPSEALVGSMERGGVVIWYNDQAGCDVMCLQTLDLLVKPLVQDKHHLILAPFHDMQHAVAITSWTRMLTMDHVDDTSILQFIKAHEDRYNPEHV
jgi:hypothetical protein